MIIAITIIIMDRGRSSVGGEPESSPEDPGLDLLAVQGEGPCFFPSESTLVQTVQVRLKLDYFSTCNISDNISNFSNYMLPWHDGRLMHDI